MVRLLTPASLASCPMLTRPAASSVILVNVLRLPVICPREAPGGGPCAASPPRAPRAPRAPHAPFRTPARLPQPPESGSRPPGHARPASACPARENYPVADLRARCVNEWPPNITDSSRRGGGGGPESQARPTGRRLCFHRHQAATLAG